MRLLCPPRPEVLAPLLRHKRLATLACVYYALTSAGLAHTLCWLGAARRVKRG